MTTRILEINDLEFNRLKAGLGALIMFATKFNNLGEVKTLVEVGRVLDDAEIIDDEAEANDDDLVELNERERVLIQGALGAFAGLRDGGLIPDDIVGPFTSTELRALAKKVKGE